MLRFPLVASYCFLGVCLGAYATVQPGFVAELPPAGNGSVNYNLAVPIFVFKHFPHGLIGLVMVGLLAVFVMGMLSRRVNGQGAIIGLIAGFLGNLWLWKYAPDISWLWWNVIGFIAAYAVGYPVSTAFAPSDPLKLSGTLIRRNDQPVPKIGPGWRRYYLVLAAYGGGILLLLVIVTMIFEK